jgi:hypothetical protein
LRLPDNRQDRDARSNTADDRIENLDAADPGLVCVKFLRG